MYRYIQIIHISHPCACACNLFFVGLSGAIGGNTCLKHGNGQQISNP